MFAFTTLLLPLLALVHFAVAQTSGTLSAPAPYAAIAPGAEFDFSYNVHADYCISSFGFTVYVVTEPPTSLNDSSLWMSGYNLGTYQVENYPAVPNPTNPAPSQLTMPDFSVVKSGWGRGFSCENCTFQIQVLEEWDDCGGTIGHKFSRTTLPVVYNTTAGYAPPA